jgi:Ca2+-binding EF-hand superfamily protein
MTDEMGQGPKGEGRMMRGMGRMRGEDGDRRGGDHWRGRGGWRGRDRSLTQDEFDARTRERFARLDKNGDNVIDASEVEAGINDRLQRGNRGERFRERMLARWDENHDGKVTKDEFLNSVKKRFARFDLNNDGRITDEDLPPIMRGRDILKSDGGATSGRRGGRHGGFMLNRLREADANKDGVITLDEVLAQASKRFDLMDRNKDGALDKSDFDALRKEMTDYRVQRFMHRFGADKDGKVTREQFMNAAKERFARLDANKDGKADREDGSGRGRR